MDELELTGTLRERAEQVLKFAEEHIKSKAGLDQIALVYQAAGVPYTDAARRFIERYNGLLLDCTMYRAPYDKENIAHVKRYKGLDKIDFDCSIIGYQMIRNTTNGFTEDVRDLKELWEEDLSEDDIPDAAAQAKANKEWQAVPVGTIGDYYAACVYITIDGRLLAFHDYEKNEMHIFDSFAEFLEFEFGHCIKPPLLICENEDT